MDYSIKKIMEEYSKLCKTIRDKERKIRDKKIEFEASLDKTRYNNPENDLKRVAFSKKMQPIKQELEKLKNQRRVMEAKYYFYVPLNDLYSELEKSTKKNGNHLNLNVEEINYVWATKPRDVTPAMLERYIKADSFTANFDITMYNKATTFYFRKNMGLSKYLKFSDGSTLKNNIMVDYSSLPFRIKFNDPGKILVPFSLIDLYRKNDAYDIKKVQKAVVKCYEKLQQTM